MYRIKAKDLVNSDEFVREPVDKEVNDILASKDKRFIITGGTGIGKSTVLRSIENRGIGSNKLTIYQCPEGISYMGIEPGEKYSKESFDTFYELYFTRRILWYIEKNYPLTFKKHFEEDKALVEHLTDEVYDALNGVEYIIANGYVKFKTNVSVGELSTNIIRKIRDVLELEELNITIDRFDQMNNCSKCVQEIYTNYFDLFDKTIIVSDDPNLNKEELTSKGYNIKQISYGKDKEVVREIIKRRIDQVRRENVYKEDKNKQEVPQKIFMSDEFLDRIVDLDGNINMILDAMYDANNSLGWSDKTPFDQILINTKKKLNEQEKSYKKIKQPTILYL